MSQFQLLKVLTQSMKKTSVSVTVKTWPSQEQTVTYGRGLGIVTGTGMDTEVGHIANMLANTEGQLTPLQRDQEQLGKNLTIAIIGYCSINIEVHRRNYIPRL